MASYKKKKKQEIENENLNNDEVAEQEQEEEKFDPNRIDHVVDRITHGLVGALRINKEDTLNKPFFKEGDIVCLRAITRLQRGDFILYTSHEQFFLRRIIKFSEDDIYVAGDAEKEYHIIHKDDVVGKAISRERKNKWLTLTGFMKKKRVYTFRKVTLAGLRLGKRVSTYEDDVNSEAYELAMQNLESSRQQTTPEKPQYVINIDLDSELQSFLNPDDLVKEWEEAERAEREALEEAAIYVDQYGQPISKEEYEALNPDGEEANANSEEEAADDAESNDEESNEDSNQEAEASSESSEEPKEAPQKEPKEESIGITDEDL